MADHHHDLNRRVQHLEDRAEITHLVHEYPRVYDEGDHDAMAELFTEEAKIDYGPGLGGPMQGRETIRAWLRGIYLFAKTSHHVSNHQVWLEGDDDARGVCYVLAWHEWPGDRPNSVLYGRYEDRYARVRDRWKISERREVQHGAEHFDGDWNWIDRSSTPRAEGKEGH